MKFIKLFLVMLLIHLLLPISASAQTSAIQIKDQALYERLPEKIKEKGRLDAVFYVNPPHIIIKNISNAQMEGSGYALSQAVGEILGIEIKYQVVDGFPSVLSGIQAGRYDIAFGPVWDSPKRHKLYDFIDYIKEADAMIVPKGNPHNLRSLMDLCGRRIGILGGGGTEPMLQNYSNTCIKQNKAAINIHLFPDKATATLAVLSKRIDAMVNSIATCAYFASNYQGKLEMARLGIESAEVYDEYYQGAIVAKGSKLAPVILAAYQKLFANGTYAAIMKKWHLHENQIPVPGINLSVVNQVNP